MLCKEFVSSSRHFSVRFLGFCKLFLHDVCLYVINTVTVSANMKRFEGFLRRV